MIRSVVLGLLRNGGSLHGYALVRAYRDLTGVQLNSGNFYRELQRLAGDGSVRTGGKDAEADPRRIHYEITGAGIAEFDAWFTNLSDCTGGNCEDELSLRSAFIAQVDGAMALRLLARWRDELWFRSQVLEREREADLMRCESAGATVFPARASLLGRRLRHVVADLEFLDEFRKTYERWRGATDRAGEESAAASVRPVRVARRGGRRS